MSALRDEAAVEGILSVCKNSEMQIVGKLAGLVRMFGSQGTNADRKTMEAALKVDCIPGLRKQGFKGSFPNFYRDTNGFVSLVNFQFSSSGGSFCVNLGYADPQRENVSFRPDTDIRQLRVGQTRAQVRLGATTGGDRWFSFGKTSYGEFRGKPIPVTELTLTCSQLLASEAENWWLSKQTIIM